MPPLVVGPAEPPVADAEFGGASGRFVLVLFDEPLRLSEPVSFCALAVADTSPGRAAEEVRGVAADGR